MGRALQCDSLQQVTSLGAFEQAVVCQYRLSSPRRRCVGRRGCGGLGGERLKPQTRLADVANDVDSSLEPIPQRTWHICELTQS